jgi:hypothetical protein
MNWDREIEVEGVQVRLGELHSILLANLTKDELEEFAAEMIKFVELSPAPLLLEEG